MSAPRGLPERIWVVTLPGGQRHFIDKPFLDGIAEWAKGMNVTIVEYHFAQIVHESNRD